MKYLQVYTLFLMLVFCNSCNSQNKPNVSKENIKPTNKALTTSYGPKTITRNMIEDNKGNIWIAAFDGVFSYDGKSFTNITNKVSSSHFFSVLQDRKGNFWFASVGSGVYYYDGKSFQNFTVRDGLISNEVTCIYEDKIGNTWFGTGAGASRYDGKSFRNFTTKEGLSSNEVNAIVEDKTGKFWFGPSGNAYAYNGKKFTFLAHKSNSFTNVRSIMEDKKGNIWLGSADGLWRYSSNTFTSISHDFVGYIYEDKKGNIWTSSEKKNSQAWALSRYDGKSLANHVWALSRYDVKTLSDKKPTVTEITSRAGMICGILEANDGSIWFGADDGVYRYDERTSNVKCFEGIKSNK